MTYKPQAVFLDFHGTISDYTFWSSLPPDQYRSIQYHLFETKRDLVHSWMRGHSDISEVVSFVSRRTSIPEVVLIETLRRELEGDVVCPDLRILISNLALICPVFLFSDNMDVISRWFGRTKSNQSFAGYWFSSDQGRLKNADARYSYLAACEENQLNIEQCVFFDDSSHSIDTFRRAGGKGVRVAEPRYTGILLNEIFLKSSTKTVCREIRC